MVLRRVGACRRYIKRKTREMDVTISEVLILNSQRQKEKTHQTVCLSFCGCGRKIRTSDLRVMSPTSYPCSTPRYLCAFQRSYSITHSEVKSQDFFQKSLILFLDFITQRKKDTHSGVLFLIHPYRFVLADGCAFRECHRNSPYIPRSICYRGRDNGTAR